jgi:hypothetical protein
MTNNEDFAEDSTMQELHQIREELERQQQESGLSILEWLEATEKDFRKSLAEDGFRMVKRGDRIFMYEIKPHSKTQKNLLVQKLFLTNPKPSSIKTTTTTPKIRRCGKCISSANLELFRIKLKHHRKRSMSSTKPLQNVTRHLFAKSRRHKRQQTA